MLQALLSRVDLVSFGAGFIAGVTAAAIVVRVVLARMERGLW